MSAADKASLRADLLLRRAASNAAQPIAGQLLSLYLPRIADASKVVAGYSPFRNEVDPRPLMARFVRAGWRMALPVTPPKGSKAPLAFHAWSFDARINTHAFGMAEPLHGAQALRPDVLLVPLLGFDARGHRLGYGGGHYDRTLRALRTEGHVCAIGLAFADQEVDLIPVHEADEALDAILTERGLTEFDKTLR